MEAEGKKKGILFKILFSLIGTVLLFVVLETTCFIINFATDGRRCQSLKNSTYPRNPERYLKIGVVGGSAAAGYNTVRSFADFIQYELNKNLSVPVYVKNFAAPGYPFHGFEAEVIKNVIERYDIFIIYEGNNEAFNYIDESGYFRKKPNKNIRGLRPLPDSQSESILHPIRFLLQNSHSFNWLNRRVQRSLSSFKTVESNFENYDKNFKEFESRGVLPEGEIEKMTLRFRNDLEEIARRAERANKWVILSSVPTNLEYRPFFSYHRPDLTEQERLEFQRLYSQGQEHFRKNRYVESVADLLSAGRIDDRPAILNHGIGMNLTRMGKRDRALPYLQKSLEYDGFPIRSFPGLHEAEKQTSLKSKNVTFVDSVEVFEKVLQRNNLSDEKLFVDLHHPNFIGHMLLARRFVCEILSKQNPGSREQMQKYCDDLSLTEMYDLAERYKKELGVTNQQESDSALKSARWHLAMEMLSAYPQDYLEQARRNLAEAYDKSQKTMQQRATFLIYQALIEANLGNRKAAVDLANQGLSLSYDYVTDSLLTGAIRGQTIRSALENKGLIFRNEQKQFVLVQN